MSPVDQAVHYKFCLFVAGGTPNAAVAVGNLTALCEACGPDYEIEVVDVFREPARALAEGIFMTPTLLRLEPGPVIKVVGTLSDTQVVCQAIGLPAMVE